MKRILITDDDKIARRIIPIFLSNYDLQLDCAANGKEAIELIQKNDYDLVLMDMHMPVMDGMTATKIIKTQLPEAKRSTIVIALTAATTVAEQTVCLLAGMDGYISKPFRPADVDKLYDFMNEEVELLQAS